MTTYFDRGSAENDRKERATEELQEKDDMIRLLLDSTAEAIYGMDLNGHCTICNPACLRLLGYSDSRELMGKNFHELIHYKTENGVPYPLLDCPVNHVIRSGTGVHVLDEIFWRADGSHFFAEYFAYPMLLNGVIVGAVVTFLDVSGRKKLEEQLLQSQKMEAIGQLAGGVAHDFNNLLTVITGYCELLMMSLPHESLSRKRVEEILKAGERSASLTRQLLAFSRKEVFSPKAMDLNAVVRNTESLLCRVIGEDIDLNIRLHPHLDRIRADAGQMEQVLLNLAVNARDAMPRGGRLSIETSNVVLDAADAEDISGICSGRYVKLMITDTGSGMSEDLKLRIFEPFFTTKPQGKGTGLGLAMVHAAVKQSGGGIGLRSEPGKGTDFRIYLPRVDAPADSEGEIAGLVSAPRGSETILLVEDDEAVRVLLVNVLQESGYTVLEAASGVEALRISAQYPDRIHLLATDVVMPGMGGRTLAEKALSMHTDMKVLYLSGYTDDAVIRHGVLQAKVEFLQKPFPPSTLARKVWEVLSKKAVA